MSEQVKVGISDYKISEPPNQLITIGLGSCVGIALYEPITKVGALIHIMLPESSGFKDTTKWEKFADLAIPKVAELLFKQTGNKKLIAKIAGGASMFSFSSKPDSIQIGKRNIKAVKDVLYSMNIPVLGEHTGGEMGRTMFVDLETFKVTVRMVNRELHIL
ncbi:chemotaxis protein CheD [Marinilactibacillus piezotolerans]|uniref:chemotaxis protein CheD n=1 Tax=Marinilactibacillus piezotolerans TaxID=258723 RepID=UPI0009B17A04|nr:chemotaxis protein CheD [Marinilactibacillus piezotolerans]